MVFLLFFLFSCTIGDITYIMHKILFLTYLWLFFTGSFISLYASGSTDVTSTEFMVDIWAFNIVWGANSWAKGIEAFKGVLGRVTDVLLFMIPIFAWVSLLIAGYFYIFSAGDSEKANKAKTIIKWNIVAILVALFSYGIVNIVAAFFSSTPL